MSDKDNDVPQDVIDKWASQCECCPDCCYVPCDGVRAGGLCDEMECQCVDAHEPSWGYDHE